VSTRALIVGSAGQDGRLLREQLAARGVGVGGLTRQGATFERVDPVEGAFDVRDAASMDRLIDATRPREVYYLAAVHRSSEDPAAEDLGAAFSASHDVHVLGFVHVLRALERHAPRARTFYAASSHVFGDPPTPVQDEETPMRPDTPYGITKAAGIGVARMFRARGRFVSAGLLYNHESPYRPAGFVSQRIARGAVAAAAARRAGEAFTLELGDLSAQVDWGFAPDYTAAMQRILAVAEPRDWVIATGEPHTVADFCRVAFDAVGLDHREVVVERSDRVNRRGRRLVGDASRLRAAGWAPSVPFEDMVRRLVAAAESDPRSK